MTNASHKQNSLSLSDINFHNWHLFCVLQKITIRKIEIDIVRISHFLENQLLFLGIIE